jgi:hypothetical protein
MEHEEINALFEKYWLAETSVDEEKAIAAYFHRPDVAPELKAYRPFFDYIEEETKVLPGPDFEARILACIQAAHSQPAHIQPPRRLHFGYAAAAALILCVSSVFLVVQLSHNPISAPTAQTSVPMKDTYEDPEKALAAVRRALLVASSHLQQGQNITRKNMSRLTNSWETAKDQLQTPTKNVYE